MCSRAKKSLGFNDIFVCVLFGQSSTPWSVMDITFFWLLSSPLYNHAHTQTHIHTVIVYTWSFKSHTCSASSRSIASLLWLLSAVFSTSNLYFSAPSPMLYLSNLYVSAPLKPRITHDMFSFKIRFSFSLLSSHGCTVQCGVAAKVGHRVQEGDWTWWLGTGGSRDEEMICCPLLCHMTH